MYTQLIPEAVLALTKAIKREFEELIFDSFDVVGICSKLMPSITLG